MQITYLQLDPKLYFKASNTTLPLQWLGQRHVPLGWRYLLWSETTSVEVHTSHLIWTLDLEKFSYNLTAIRSSFTALPLQPIVMTNLCESTVPLVLVQITTETLSSVGKILHVSPKKIFIISWIYFSKSGKRKGYIPQLLPSYQSTTKLLYPKPKPRPLPAIATRYLWAKLRR